ncbi:helix-turn-helix transcriptional regulator [Aquibacillus halophilus]|nr:helix-turn-helix transcriptional regulator [Aquibacillus halophilus]
MIKKSSVKEKILLKLKRGNRLTIVQLMEGFHITDIALRRHIHTLEREGLIQSFQEKQTMGRPHHVYQLTDKGGELFPNQYQQFSVDLLKEVEEIQGIDFVYQLLASRTDKSIDEYKKLLEDVPDYNGKIKKLVQIQEDKGYMTELQENADGSYTLKQFNCPISNVAREYKGICGQELNLFEELLEDSSIAATSCIVSGENCCSFLIGEKKK